MRVLFLENVPNVAKAGDIKEVASGYARNHLIPKKLALLANSPDAALLEVQRKASQKRIEDETSELAQQLDGKEIILKAKAGAKDRLYGSVTSADIAAELESTTGLAIDKRKIELTEPIHQLGNYEVDIRLAKDAVPKIKVTVIAEEVKEEEKAKTKTKAKAEKKKTKKRKKEDIEGEGKEKAKTKTKAKAEKKETKKRKKEDIEGEEKKKEEDKE